MNEIISSSSMVGPAITANIYFSDLPAPIHQSFQTLFKISLSAGIRPSTELHPCVCTAFSLVGGWRRLCGGGVIGAEKDLSQMGYAEGVEGIQEQETEGWVEE